MFLQIQLFLPGIEVTELAVVEGWTSPPVGLGETDFVIIAEVVPCSRFAVVHAAPPDEN